MRYYSIGPEWLYIWTVFEDSKIELWDPWMGAEHDWFLVGDLIMIEAAHYEKNPAIREILMREGYTAVTYVLEIMDIFRRSQTPKPIWAKIRL